MALRVTSEEVKQIVYTPLEDLTAFITPANLIVDQLDDPCLTEDLKKEIERWLSAHFVSIGGSGTGQVKKEVLGDGEMEYFGTGDGSGYNSTTFGQTALSLDCSGQLKNMGKQRATIKHLG